jgi:AraC family transcriptional regulator, transcriptional activator of pobA
MPQELSQHITTKQEHKSDLFQAFIQLLTTDNGIKNKVAYYAHKLNTTPQNINAACQKSIQKPATEVLSEFVLNESKRLLLYTDKTISEIVFALEFADPSHFVKYFKKWLIVRRNHSDKQIPDTILFSFIPCFASLMHEFCIFYKHEKNN